MERVADTYRRMQLQNNILVLSLEESDNADLCLETSFPVVCASNGKSEVLDYLELQQRNGVPSSVLLKNLCPREIHDDMEWCPTFNRKTPNHVPGF